MKKPNDETGRFDDIYSSSEGIYETGEKTPVDRDEKTVADDANDYMYLKPKRKRHHHDTDGETVDTDFVTSESGSGGNEGESGSDGGNMMYVTSARGSHHHHHHHGSRRKKKMKGWKKALLIVGCVLLSLVLITVGTVFILINKGNQELFNSEDVKIVTPEEVPAQVQDDGKYIVYNGETYKMNEHITNILFMGVDMRDIENLTSEGLGGQADAIVMMAMDFDKNKVSMIAIPRDTVTDVAVYSVGGSYAGMRKQQICLSYAYGDGKDSSCENMVASVRRLFYNIPVSTYFALDLDGISELNDAVGGVDVVSPETIGQFVEGEQYHLEGSDAETFVRNRRIDRLDANLFRMERQKIYTKSFVDKGIAQTKENISVPLTLFNESAPYSCTNLNPAKVTSLAREVIAGKGMSFDFLRIDCDIKENPDDGRALYYVKDKEFFEMFLGIYYDKVTSLDDAKK